MLTEPPRNGEYLVAAYIVTTVILVGYWLRLWRMARKNRFSPSQSVRLLRGGVRGNNTCSQSSAASKPPTIGPTQ